MRTTDGLDLHVHVFGPEGPKATVALFHGYGEHAGRYAHLGAALGARGIATVTADLRGHGRSPGVRGHVDRFSDYHLDATAIFEAAKARGGKTFVFGHSMGGLLALDWLTAGVDRGLAGLVLSSPYLGLALKVNPLKKLAAKALSGAVPTLALPTGLSGVHVTRDPEEARRYDSDPLNNKAATARWFTESLAAMDRVFARAGGLRAPTLLLYGGDDKVASADDTDRLASLLSMEDRTTQRLGGYYHELVNEPAAERAPIIERIGDWILERA